MHTTTDFYMFNISIQKTTKTSYSIACGLPQTDLIGKDIIGIKNEDKIKCASCLSSIIRQTYQTTLVRFNKATNPE